MPKVTVLMPAYNVGKYIRESIDSILKQTYSDFCLLVINDCSTDDTLDVVSCIKDKRITLISNETNLGLAATLNKGLDLIRTEYVARMDGDDIAEPFWLEKELSILETHPEIGVCGGGFEWFGTKKGVVRYPEKHEDIVANMLFGCTVIVPTFRMSLVRDYDLKYKETAFPAEDYRFWAECLRVTRLYNIQETLFHYRMHSSQISTSKDEIQREKANEVREYILDWLDCTMDEATKEFFFNNFLNCKINNKKELKLFHHFADKLVAAAENSGNFSPEALRNRLEGHIKNALYYSIIENYFEDGYSIRRYLQYVSSRLAYRTKIKNEIKFFAKCLLNKSH